MDEKPEKTEEEKVCPICGQTDLVKIGHCETCYSCGYSACSL